MLKKIPLVLLAVSTISCGTRNPNAGHSSPSEMTGANAVDSSLTGRTLTDFSGTWNGKGMVSAGGSITEKPIVMKIVYDSYYDSWKIRAYADGGSMGGFITSNITEADQTISTSCGTPRRDITLGDINGDVLTLNHEYEIDCLRVSSSIRATLRADGKVDVALRLSKNRNPFSTVNTTLSRQEF